MTLSEAAKVLGVDPGTLRVQIHNGKLRGKKVGPIWTVSQREIDRYRIEHLRRGPTHGGLPKISVEDLERYRRTI
jgi:excisionase family DNA binding protein